MAQSRKWLITINNPLEHGFDHVRIKAAVNDLPALLYWCMCDEKGDECETLHTHVYFVCENGLTHTQVDARFPSFHRDIARGKSSENRAYVLKDGAKFNKQPDGSYSYKDTGGHLHEGVNFSDTFEEGGEMPNERQGKSRDADIIVGMIKEGASNEEIVNAVASAYYCHPFCSSERGSNENANKIIRRYFRKGKSLYHVTQAQCDAVAERMNAMHRKILDYHTAQELFDAHVNSL